MIRSAAAAALLVVGCSATPPTPTPEAAPVALVSAAPGPSVTALSPRPRDPSMAVRGDLERLACAGRKPCRLLRLHDAGRGADGSELRVALLHFGFDAWSNTQAPGQEPLGWHGERRRDRFEASHGGCHKFAYVLLAAAADDEAAPRVQHLADVCNDGHGAAGVGEVSGRVGSNHFVFQQSGGSSWRWANTTSLQLAPLRRVERSVEGFWTLGPNQQHQQWNWRAFRGEEVWHSPDCAARDVEAPERAHQRAHVLIPKLTLPKAFVHGAWTNTALGRCAAEANGRRRGYLLSGSAEPDSARLRVVASADELFVELFDDVWRSAAPGTAGDTLELWFSPKHVSYDEHCVDRHADPPLAVAFDPATGRQHKLSPQAPHLTVAHAARRGTVRFAIELPAGTKALSLVYRDADGATGHERVIATSRFKSADRTTLGGFVTVSDKEAACHVEGGELVPRLAAPKLEPAGP
jgi:hypothetical protein